MLVLQPRRATPWTPSRTRGSAASANARKWSACRRRAPRPRPIARAAPRAYSRIVSSIQKRLVRVAEEALVDERLERVEVGVGHLLPPPRACSRRRRRRGRAKSALLVRRRAARSSSRSSRAACAGARAGRARRRSGAGAAARAARAAARGESAFDARGGELDRERQVVEPAADLAIDSSSARSPGDRARARARKRPTPSSGASGGTTYSCSPATRSGSRLVTSRSRSGHAASSSATSAPRRRPARSCRRRAAATCRRCARRAPSFGAERLRGRLDDELRVAERRERHPPRRRAGTASASSAAACSASRVLPVPPGPGQREQAHVVAREELSSDLGELPLPPEEGRRRHRQVRPVETLERRELVVAELVDPLGRGRSFSRWSPRSRSPSAPTSARSRPR